MGSFIKNNGFLTSSTFLLAMVLPWGLVAVYLYALLNLAYAQKFDATAYYYLAILCWIFFGVKSKDIFENGKSATLRNKHIVMFSIFLINCFSNSDSIFGSFIGLGLIILIANKMDHKHMGQGLFWQKTLPANSFSKEKILSSVKKEFLVTEPLQSHDSYLIKGYGFVSLKITVELTSSNLNIRIEPMNSGFNFFLGLKAAPYNIGELYGEKVLKHLGVISDDTKAIVKNSNA